MQQDNFVVNMESVFWICMGGKCLHNRKAKERQLLNKVGPLVFFCKILLKSTHFFTAAHNF